eukprot:PhM_4_TR409/c1_g1_i6/m.76004
MTPGPRQRVLRAPHLPQNEQFLRATLDLSLAQGKAPHAFKRALIVPLPKPGKDTTDPSQLVHGLCPVVRRPAHVCSEFRHPDLDGRLPSLVVIVRLRQVDATSFGGAFVPAAFIIMCGVNIRYPQ